MGENDMEEKPWGKQCGENPQGNDMEEKPWGKLWRKSHRVKTWR